jgi:hypothetical protein
LHATRSEGTDVPDIAVERRGQRGTGDVDIVRGHHEVVRRRQLRDQTGGGGHILDELRLPTEQCRCSGQRLCNRSATDDHQLRNRPEHGDDRVVHNVRSTCPRLEQLRRRLPRSTDRGGIEQSRTDHIVAMHTRHETHRPAGEQLRPQITREFVRWHDEAPHGAWSRQAGDERIDVADPEVDEPTAVTDAAGKVGQLAVERARRERTDATASGGERQRIVVVTIVEPVAGDDPGNIDPSVRAQAGLDAERYPVHVPETMADATRSSTAAPP